ncbi:hypothetical protein [Paraburkholderia elongata]|uniref:Uncharacterized protein n=1 Tax=Paraburkholderia elongata TaxID=2675747 RepID=A0A972NWF7_9BURK|nr:hypothetical protein [Paraburkholderia elongata]NPT59708.1 hypothetical protein [Paraburkholderia elongata]
MAENNDGGPAFPAPYHPQEGIKTVNPTGMTLRAYFAAHADISEFDIDEHVFEVRSARATYTSEPASPMEIAEAVADLKVMLADALIRRLARGEA